MVVLSNSSIALKTTIKIIEDLSEKFEKFDGVLDKYKFKFVTVLRNNAGYADLRASRTLGILICFHNVRLMLKEVFRCTKKS